MVVESRPERAYGAEVLRVDTVARPRSSESPVQYFGVTLELEATDPEVMKPGQRVRAEILVRELEEVLVIPRQAVSEEDGRAFVHRLSRGRLVKTAVDLGAAGLGWVVVEQGLEEGDSIAARDPLVRLEASASAGGSATPGAGGGAE